MMKNPEILLLINSFLLTIVTLSFLVIGYFLKSLHKDFKDLIGRVNQLYLELNTHARLFDTLSKAFQSRLEDHDDRLKKLEGK